jgi:hypothetical protein
MNRLDFKGIAGGLQARLLASFPSVGIQARNLSSPLGPLVSATDFTT